MLPDARSRLNNSASRAHLFARCDGWFSPRSPQQADHTKSDTAVGDIKRRPRPISPIKKEKVDHLTVQKTVNEVADCPPEDTSGRNDEECPLFLSVKDKEE